MRGIRIQFELGHQAVANNWRYTVNLSDGLPGPSSCLANPNDQYSEVKWTSLLGVPVTKGVWTTVSSEGMYVSLDRQLPNSEFNFNDPDQYQRREWIKALYPVTELRIYNPWIGRPFLSWPVKGGWGKNYTFSEGDTGYFSYAIDDYELGIKEQGQYRVHRLNDSSNYKEFIILLGV